LLAQLISLIADKNDGPSSDSSESEFDDDLDEASMKNFLEGIYNPSDYEHLKVQVITNN